MDLSDASEKSPLTRPGIDPGTFRLVTQRLNHHATPGPVCHSEKENWRILTSKEIYAIVKKTHYNRDTKVK
jgi:hypothetical protein